MTETMRAAVLHAPGQLVVEQVEKPAIQREQDVLVRVKAVGICGSDLGRIMVTGTYRFPTIPGHEFCGIVEAVGDGVTNVQKGDRVLVCPILPCGTCEHCQKGNYGQCTNYNYLGSRTDGGMAEYVIAPERNLLKMPESVGFAEGAAMEPAAVTLHGMRKVRIEPGDCVAVLGCGTIGLYAIQFAHIMGATRIIAVDIDERKLDWAKRFGATDCVNSLQHDAVEAIRALTGGSGTTVTVETAGSSVTQEQCFRTVNAQGRVLLLGTAHKDVVLPPKTFEAIIRNELSIVGSWNSFSAPFPGADWHAVIAYAASGQLNLEAMITHRISLEEAPETIAAMAKHEFFFNKVVIEI